jgi:putative transposase
LYPSKTIQRVLEAQLELCRELYNQLLMEIKTAWENKQQITQIDTQSHIVLIKKDQPAFNDVYSKVLQMVNRQLWANIRSLAARRQNGYKVGRLRYKGKNQFKTLNFNQSGFQINLERKRLVLSKVGSIPIRIHRRIEGLVKGVIVKQYRSGKWFAIIQVELHHQPKLTQTGHVVGLDVGLQYFLTDSDGRQIENPRFYEKSLKRIGRLSQQISKKKKDSQNWKKMRIKLARAYEKIVSQRDDFLHKLSRFYVNSYDVIVIEDLMIRNMVRNQRLGKRILDASWGKFFQMLLFKAESAGRTVTKIHPQGTSQECHFGELDRDYNAALNIRQRGLGRPLQPVEIRPLRCISSLAMVQGKSLQ